MKSKSNAEQEKRKKQGRQERIRADRGMLSRTGVILILCGIVAFLPVVGMLTNLMVFRHDEYSEKALNNQTRTTTVTASRGSIYDRNMNVMAVSTSVENVFLDPKCDWALQNLGEFPVEINRAPYETLLRVPGIGVKSAMRIVATRKQVALRFEDLKKMGVVLKRAVYFITCSGRMMYPVQIHEDAIAAQLISEEKRKQWQLSQSGLDRQMSLFDDFHMAQA